MESVGESLVLSEADHLSKCGFPIYKLLGGARRVASGIDAWVRPVLVPRNDPLAQIDGVDNAVSIETARAGRLTLQGPGAGGDASAAAILGDLVAAARRRTRIELGVPCAM